MIRELLEANKPLPPNANQAAVQAVMVAVLGDLARHMATPYLWLATCTVAVEAGCHGGRRRVNRRLKLARMAQQCAAHLGVRDPLAHLPKGWEYRNLAFGYDAMRQAQRVTNLDPEMLILLAPRTVDDGKGGKEKTSFAELLHGIPLTLGAQKDPLATKAPTESQTTAKHAPPPAAYNTKELQNFWRLNETHKTTASKLCERDKALGEVIGHDLRQIIEFDPEYRRLRTRAIRLSEKIQKFFPHIIRANLATFGVEDMLVTGIIRDEQGDTELGRTEMLLSDLCGLRYHGLAKLLGIKENTGLSIIVEKNGRFIGRIDCDGDFNYTEAPNLRTALAWKIATDGGRGHIIEGFDLDAATQKIFTTIEANGTTKDGFFDAFFPCIKSIFVCDHTSRFGDGYCGAIMVLWRNATRELGCEHSGYSFGY